MKGTLKGKRNMPLAILAAALLNIGTATLAYCQHFSAFAAPRESVFRPVDSLPGQIERDAPGKTAFQFQARPDEFFVYQVGVRAQEMDLEHVDVVFYDLVDSKGEKISARKMTCFTTSGVDFKGNPFQKEVDVASGKLQMFWIGVDLSGIRKGDYEGVVTIKSGTGAQTLKVSISAAGAPLPDHGFDEGKRMARLAWLNSTVGINDDITRGYLPLKLDKDTVKILGRSLVIGKDGLPADIKTYFSSSNEAIEANGSSILSKDFRFVVEKANGETITLKPGKIKITDRSASHISWEVTSNAPECTLVCKGRMEYDGFVDYALTLKAAKELQVKDIRLEVPVDKSKAQYMMGLGREGGQRPEEWNWQWDTTKNQDMLWIGAVNGGMRLKWKAENYKRPLVNIYYAFGPLQLPPSWGNQGKGGVAVKEEDKDVLVNAYSGARTMQPGQALHYDFELLLTPFHTIDKDIKYGDRYYHGGGPDSHSKVEKAETAGANVVVIHQSESLYPFINYPYLDENIDSLKDLVSLAHKAGQRMKLYYTTRELTKNLPEFFAFYSMNGELIFPGPGNASRTVIHPNGPNEWLINNLGAKYIPAWYNPIEQGRFKGQTDLSVITVPDSRLNNFYIAGLDWMLQNLQIDGIYIDDAATDRFTLRRARKLIDQYRPAGRMDMHSWNHFCAPAGYASCLNLYMDLLPYLDLVWIGEARNYDRMPDHWLVEVSGIPFGLPGQMLEGGGNPWRGMVYGITTRAGWTKNPPTEIWKFWDEYQIKDKELIGYWDKECPVKVTATGGKEDTLVMASVYKGKGQSIIAVANWSKDDQTVTLQIDWQKLGIDPTHCTINVPVIKDYQDEFAMDAKGNITVPGKKGYLIVIAEK